MSAWWRGKPFGLIAYLGIVALVVGGLGWVTAAALRLELSDRMRLALWRLDSRVSPALAREDSRPYQHYDPLHVPVPAIQRQGQPVPAGSVLLPSPLLDAELPDWLLLHFQANRAGVWRSPEVPSEALTTHLRQTLHLSLNNVTPRRAELLAALAFHPQVSTLFDRLPEPTDPGPPAEAVAQQQAQPGFPNQAPQAPDNDYATRTRQQSVTRMESRNSGLANNVNFDAAPFGEDVSFADIGGKVAAPGSPISLTTVRLSSLTPRWLEQDGRPPMLVAVRTAQTGDRHVVQGVLLDWERLQAILGDEIRDLFPDARFVPVLADQPESPERAMTALPVHLDPGRSATTWHSGWTPLRVGLMVAWAAALLALLMVGLGGWSLFDLSERRFRFVSAVTHELRTPLTTLRLYLDMLTSGFVREEAQKADYLRTLHQESDRLHRLIGNVLDFARLEKQRPRLERKPVPLNDLLEQVRSAWIGRCESSGKQLIVEIGPGCPATLATDAELVQQVLGNLIDNACKYSQGAADGRIWMRARREGERWLALEVEDRGPGVPSRERRGIFRPFRRGRGADEAAGGVGLGLALADRWARLIGGRLQLQPGREGVGACFQVMLPL